jgi:ComF family protein
MSRDWILAGKPAMPVWKRTWAGFLNLLFPDNCRLCEQPLVEAERYPVCSGCVRSAEPMVAEHFCTACQMAFSSPYPLDENGVCAVCRSGLVGFDRAYSFGFYEGALRALIHEFKYGGIETLAKPLGEFLLSALPRDRVRPDVIVPVPMHWLRRWQRGYNQTNLLAVELSRRSGIPLAYAATRSRRTPPQAGLSAKERRRNVAGVFTVRQVEAVRGRHVLLLDDVLTTGATASACAAALKRAGAARVTVLTLARVDRRMTMMQPAEVTRTKIATTNTAGG